jgi:hypothetical protein
MNDQLSAENQRLRQEIEALRLQHELRQSENLELLAQTEALRVQTALLQSQKQALRTQVEELERIRRNLEHAIAVYKRSLFGARSGKIDPKELEAHIRRDIFEARDDAPLAVDLVPAAIQKLHRIETHAKAKAMTLEARPELRQRQAQPIFIEVGQLIATMRQDVLPNSPLGKALSYAENQRPAMARYLEVPSAELDNNSIEHSLRGVVLGRRNWLHVAGGPGSRRREGGPICSRS